MKSSSPFTSVSRLSEVFTSFRGPLKSFPIVKSIDRNKGTLRRWIVFSQGKRSTLVQYLFGKLLWDDLNFIEREVFWHLSEITSDVSIYLSLKAFALGVDRKIIRQRLNSSPFFELKGITRQQYLTLKGRINFFLLEEEINLRRVTKYSGYTKHYKDKGSLGTERDLISEVLDPVFSVKEEILLHYLTVGEFSLFRESVILHPDESQKTKRSPKKMNKTKTKR